MSVLIRQAVPEDGPFLDKLAYDHFYEALAAWAWDPSIREPLLKMQIQGQRATYRSQFPGAENGIILFEDRAIGRMLVDRGAEFDTLVDIVIVKDKRGAGIGTELLRALCAKADLAHRAIRLQVQSTNRARILYERLGFRTIEDAQVLLEMERPPNQYTNTTS
jgi:GNAT superfamily N-acetyltransferase